MIHPLGIPSTNRKISTRLTACFLLIVIVDISRPRLTPPRLEDHLWAYAIICAFPVGAFLSAKGAQSGIPFLIYGGAAAGILAFERLDYLTHRYALMDAWSHVRETTKLALLLMCSCRLAASLRWWLARRRERPREPRCAKCGYLLYGLPEPRCPECGEPFDETLLAVKDIGGRHEK